MSIHPSLNTPEKDKKPRSVLKRIERLRIMLEKGLWKEGNSVFGLPKIKTVRIKIKKEKAAEKPEVAAIEGATPTTTEIKEQPVAAKGSATAKTQEKK